MTAKPARLRLSDALGAGKWPRIRQEAERLLMSQPGLADFASAARIVEASDLGPEARIAVLSDSTTHAVRSCLPVVMLALGARASIYEAGFNTWQMELADSASGFSRSGATTTLLALSTRSLPEVPPFASPSDVDARARRTVDDLARFWTMASDRTGTAMLQHNFALPPEQPLGRLEMKYAWSRRRFAQRLNELLWDHDGIDIRVVDVASLAARLGEDRWLDRRWHYQGKHLFNPGLVAEYALMLRGTMAARLGRMRKVLVIDLDDTLWGDMVGEVGPRGIVFGPGTPEGEAFLDFSLYLRDLRRRGVLLAINSRNDRAVVAEAFESHPSMPLTQADFAAVHCHWDSKSAHLKAIAAELNVGLDSLVFVDNDEVNIAEARENCPEVLSVHLPPDPAIYASVLDRLALFDPEALTAEDASRAESIPVMAQLKAAEQGPADLQSFLAGLGLRGAWRPARREEFARVEQLFLKTNQFNLTKRSWTRPELEGLGEASDTVVVVFELGDRVAQYGIIAAAVAGHAGGWLGVSNLVVSCRVFSRTVEHYILNALRDLAVSRGLAGVGGEFVATNRNHYARDFLARESLMSAPADGATAAWRFASGQPALATFVTPAGEPPPSD